MKRRKKMLQGLAVTLGCAMVFGLGGGFLVPHNGNDGVTVVAEAADTCQDEKGFTYRLYRDSAEVINYANYDNISEVKIPESIQSGGKSYPVTGLILRDSVLNGDAVTEIEIPGSISYINRYTFRSFPNLESIDVKETATQSDSYYYSEDGVLFYRYSVYKQNRRKPAERHQLICYPAQKKDPSYTIPQNVTTLGNNCFANAHNLQNVSLAENAELFALGSYAFYDCSNLQSVQLPEKLKTVPGHAFDGCRNLQKVDLPASLPRISKYAFYGCSSLGEIHFPNSLETIAAHAFEGCSSLTFDSLPNSLTALGAYAFAGCQNVNSVKIPENIRELRRGVFSGTGLQEIIVPDNIRIIRSNAFENCTALQKVTLPERLADLKTAAFRNCGRLSEINIPESLTKIKPEVFRGCMALKEITIPDSVTIIASRAFEMSGLEKADLKNVQEIRGFAFEMSPNLREVILGSSLNKIGRYAFYGCPNLAGISIPNEKTEIKQHALGYQDYDNSTPGSVNMHKRDFNITGKKGSTAESYAKKNKTTFTDEAGNVTKPEEEKKDNKGTKDRPVEDTKTQQEQVEDLQKQLEELKKAQSSGSGQTIVYTQDTVKIQALEKEIQTLKEQAADQKTLEEQIRTLQDQIGVLQKEKTEAVNQQKAEAEANKSLKDEIVVLKGDLAAREKETASAQEDISRNLVKLDRIENVRVSVKKKKIVVKWARSEVNTLNGYRVYYSAKKSRGYQSLGETKQTVCRKKISLKKGRAVYVKVRGFKIINGRKVWTRYSLPVKYKSVH